MIVICELAEGCTTACQHRRPHEERKRGIADGSYCDGICTSGAVQRQPVCNPVGDEEDIT